MLGLKWQWLAISFMHIVSTIIMMAQTHLGFGIRPNFKELAGSQIRLKDRVRHYDEPNSRAVTLHGFKIK